jgi:hypothetical protein
MTRRLTSSAPTHYSFVRRNPTELLKFMLQSNGRKVKPDLRSRSKPNVQVIHASDLEGTRVGGEPQLKADQLKPGSGDCSGAFPRCP